MLGAFPFTSRRNLSGASNQTLPELTIGLFIRRIVFSSRNSACTCGAAARRSRIFARTSLSSAEESGAAFAGDARKTKTSVPIRKLCLIMLILVLMLVLVISLKYVDHEHE